MEINLILNEISSTLRNIEISNRVNNYNMIAGRLGKPQYSVSFEKLAFGEGVSNGQDSSLVITQSEQSIEDILMRSIELSSHNNKVVDVLNRRLDIERINFKGSR
ncbi:SSU ribosomal protein S3p (S3e), mitochondrial [Vibrio chagasii]|uniref:hypothetical protein n=1 Tax=Vibrio chagasii TaxID=170679 RepID=UPI003374EF9E|nr:SSU ribosomal protein S3p (S3e), mitochondrial [Vibrio chagasii]